ncbi:MAG: tetratricopeptide repeat protein [candidate division Zixibacteria bacterium]|nr:tetratricopeptide repeat protein [candidate division Zixibacteria bacterium]
MTKNKSNSKKRKLAIKKKNKDVFPRKELKAIDKLEKMMEAGDYSGIKRAVKKTIYKELTNKVLRERAVYLGAFAITSLNEPNAALRLLREHVFIPDNVDREYLYTYLLLKVNEPEAVIKHGSRYLRFYRNEPEYSNSEFNRTNIRNRHEVHNFLALAYKKMFLAEKAIREFKYAIRFKNDYEESILNLISLLIENNRFAESEELCDKYRDVLQNNPQLESLHAIAVFGSGETETGEKLLNRLLEKYPDSPDAILNLGVMYQKTGDYNKAREYYLKAREIAPEHRGVIENLFKLEVNHFGKEPAISLCMIVKNEEDNIARCLNSIKDVVDQMVVVDTGSTDRTAEIAGEMGAEVYHHPWRNSFSEARNNSIKYATGDWIIYLDADEELFEEDKEKLRQAARDTNSNAVSIQIFNPTHGKQQGYLRFTRMWRNHLGFHFEGIVHNQLVYDGFVNESDVRIRHYGYGYEKEKMEKKYERSSALLLEQLEENPDNTFALFNLAQIRRGQQNHEEVIKYASRLTELINEKTRGQLHLYLMGLDQLCTSHFFLKDYRKSIEFGKKALKVKPDYFDPMLTIASAYTAIEDFEQALHYYNLFLETIDSFDPEKEKVNLILNNLGSEYYAYYGIGAIYRRMKRYKEAEKYLLKVSEQVENHLKLHFELGQLAFDRKDYQAAKKEFELDLRYNKDSSESHFMLGEVLAITGEKKNALPYYKMAVELGLESPVALFKYAETLSELNRFDEAKTAIETLIEKYPDFSSAYRVKGNIDFQLKDYKSAVSAYQKFLTDNPEDYKIISNLGNSHLKNGDYEDAIRSYDLALNIKPDCAINYLNLAICYKEMDRWSEAVANFKRYADLNPTDTDIFVAIADCLASDERYTEAISYYEKYLSRNPGDYLAIFKMSECYRIQGALDAADLGYNAVLKMNPEFEPAKRMKLMLSGEAAKA